MKDAYWIAVLLIVFSIPAIAQHAAPTIPPEPKSEEKHRHNFNPFKYNEHDFPFALDVGGSVGVNAIGVQAGLSLNLDVYHIMCGLRNVGSTDIGGKQATAEKSYYFGYRYRTNKIMFSAAAGFGQIKYKCTSGLNDYCHHYKDEQLKGVPIDIQVDYICCTYAAIGATVNIMGTDRETLGGLMFTLKVGLMKNPCKKGKVVKE